MVKIMIEIFALTLWAGFTTYMTWYFTSAKHYAPITSDEAKTLWKIHKQNIGCNAKKWREISRRGKTIGFECECGYKHIQRRPIVTNTPAANAQTETALDRIHTSYKSA
jgi:hypothetical protein